MELKSDNNWNYSYDKNGNLTQKDNGVDEYWFYEFDEKNRLVYVKFAATQDGTKTTKGHYFYDNGGLRIKKIEGEDIGDGQGKTTIYIYAGQDILFEECFNSVNQQDLGTGEYREYNVFLNGMNLAKYVGSYDSGWSYTVKYHTLDHLGSRQVVADSGGNVAGEGNGDVEYRSFGRHAGGDKTEYAFTGKRMSEHEADRQLVYFNARWLDPEIGRFISEDPIRDGANWYVYCGNNPLRYVDPDGMLQVDKSGGVIFYHSGIIDYVPASKPEMTFKAKEGYIKTNNGTKINAMRKVDRTTDNGYNTNCHGQTFTNGELWINNNEAQKILDNDGYGQLVTPEEGAVAIFRDSNGDIVHSAIVTNVDMESGNFTVHEAVGNAPGTQTTTYEGIYQTGPWTVEYYIRTEEHTVVE